MLRTDLPPITTQIISCVILNTADHNTTDFPGHDAVLNCSLLPIKHSTHFFFFSQNNAHTRNCAVWMDTQVTCCVRSSTGNLNFMDPKPINSKYVTFLNSGNVEVLLEMLIEVHKSNNYFQTAFIIIKTLWLLYLSHLLITMASTVNIIHLSLMRKIKLHIQWFPRRHMKARYSKYHLPPGRAGAQHSLGSLRDGLLRHLPCCLRKQREGITVSVLHPCLCTLVPLYRRILLRLQCTEKKTTSQNCRHLSDSAVHMHYNFFPFTRALLYISAEAGQRAAPLHHSVCSPKCFLLGKQKSHRTNCYCSALVLSNLRDGERSEPFSLSTQCTCRVWLQEKQLCPASLADR